MLRLIDIVDRRAILPVLQSSQRDDVIMEMVNALVQAGVVPQVQREELVGKVLERERKGSTGFGRGVAVPHVKHKNITKMVAAVGVSARGIDFNALDTQPVYSVFLLLSPEDRPEQHLQAMEAIFKNLSKDTFRRFLRQAASADDVWTLLEEADAASPGA